MICRKALEGLSGVYIVHGKEETKFEEAEGDFEKVKFDDEDTTPPPEKPVDISNGAEDTQDTDDREAVNEEVC